MADYIPPTLDWVREQVELYESSGGTQGNKTGGIRKIPVFIAERRK